MKLLPLLIILTLSCANLTRPPSKGDMDSETREFTTFLNSVSNGSKIECREYREYLDIEFPLRPWVEANYHQVCNSNLNILTQEYNNKDKYPYWAREELINAIITKPQISDSYASAVIEKLSYLNTRREKEQLLLSAQKIAKDSPEQLEQINDKLYKLSARYIPTPGKDDYFEIAKSYERNRDFKNARKFYRKIIRDKASSKEEIVSAWFKVAHTYKRERRNDSFKAKLRGLVLYLQKNRDSEELKDKHAKYSIRLARVYWTEDNLQRAVRVLRNLLLYKEVPNEHIVTTYYTIGGIFEDLRKYDRSIKFFQKAYANIEKEHEHLDSIVWNLAWTNYKNQNYSKMIRWFDQYEAKEEKPNYRFLYWKFIALKRINKFKEANDLLLKIQKEDSFGYYGQIAHINHSLLTPISTKTDFNINIDELAWSVFLNDEKLSKKIIDSNKKVSFEDLYAAKYYNIMIFKFFRQDEEKKKSILVDNPQFAFPLAYKKEFLENNRSKIVTTPLLMSIARQESAFNQYARSPADAFGLLQLIPEQGKRLSRRYKIPFKDYHDLYDPKINITFSSLLLNELMKRNDKNFINFVASYNAGGTPIKRWRKRIKLPDLEFIEEIPYKETRKYVKLVARNYLIYSRMLSTESIKIDDNFFRGSFIDMKH